MNCQNLFSEEKEKTVSACRLLKIILRVLSVNLMVNFWAFEKGPFRVSHNLIPKAPTTTVADDI